MNDREILVPEVAGKTIRAMRLMVTRATGETEFSIDFTDGTSFSATACQRTKVEAELYIGGTGEPQILQRYDDF